MPEKKGITDNTINLKKKRELITNKGKHRELIRNPGASFFYGKTKRGETR